MSLVARIDALGHASGIFTLMNTPWGWPIAESLHFIGLSLLIGTVGVVDLRMMGFVQSIPLSALHRLTRWGIAGFLINVVTGTAFFVSAPDQYLFNPAFQLKVLCMLLAGVNAVAFYCTIASHVVGEASPATVPRSAQLVAFISFSAWTGVIAFGRLITFYRPPEHWCFWCT